MTPHEAAILFAGCAFGTFLLTPLAVWRITANLRAYKMQIADLVTGLEAVTAQLTPLPAEITAAISAGDATALATIDAPFAALQSAVAAVAAALPAPTEPAA